MRDKILAALRSAGHGLTPNELQSRLFISPTLWFLDELKTMEVEKLVFLHRADGSANTTKGEIVLVVLRPTDHELVQIGPNAFLKIQKSSKG